ncbi:hypothetical protein HY993_03870 [Candidatus Micrarchaeota archaeon]|nr:hypothetical protein [Candidatus Micrarchaeota archaeon]
MQILKQSRENLFGRIELEALIEGIEGATPSRKEVIAGIAKEIGKSADVIAIRKIDQKFGRTKAIVYARVYETKEQKEKMEQKTVLERGGRKKGGKKEESPSAAAPAKTKENVKKEEKKAEEKKEEKKA